MPATVVRDATEPVRREEEHLVLPRIGIQGPSMAEDDGLARSPVFEVNPRAVLRREPVHRPLLFRPSVRSSSTARASDAPDDLPNEKSDAGEDGCRAASSSTHALSK